MDKRKDPFPGMNPFLEHRWGDVHARLSSYTTDMIQEQLPDPLRARMQERVFIETEAEAPQGRVFSPDVYVVEYPRSTGLPDAEAEDDGGVAVAVDEGPILIHVEVNEVTESYIEIIDAGSGGRVVTAIEFISQSNKRPGPGRIAYLRKQKEYAKGRVNSVEIDLLRTGRPVTLVERSYRSHIRKTPYHACVSRAARREAIEYYPMPLQSPLPVIRIPLRRGDADVKLNLQSLIDEAYRKGRYDDIDYTELLEPPLSNAETRWMKQLVAFSGSAEGTRSV